MLLKRSVPAVCLLFAVAVSGLAKIGDAPAAYEARFGPAIKEAFDGAGSGLSVYRTKEFEEIRVTFVKGTSKKEVYKYEPGTSLPQTSIEAIRAENQDHNVLGDEGDYGQISVVALDNDSVDYLARPSGQEKTYSGVVKEKAVGEQRWAVLSDHGTVIELPIAAPAYPQ